MAVHHLPEIDELIRSFGRRMAEVHEEVRQQSKDVQYAVVNCGSAREAIDYIESAALLRRMPDDVPVM